MGPTDGVIAKVCLVILLTLPALKMSPLPNERNFEVPWLSTYNGKLTFSQDEIFKSTSRKITHITKRKDN